ncbi:non-homologous end-joining DNA ligase [Nocardiopsis mangrovi]|uniref:Non-homologous end-joining DNA ligase n=1 Tax=Nocardiopsis mangrovi TaxID=1179818 RepID=A0ABV9DRT7_9ACTN
MGKAVEDFAAGRRRVGIGRPGKELFGAGGVTKRELAEHYRRVAPVMLPHVRGRPLALHRFPDGIDPGASGTPGFFQKNLPEYTPEWVRGVRVERMHGDPITMPVCDDTATLLWLADQAAITLHPWTTRAAALRRPDRMVIDLDPPGRDFAAARRAARDVREVLAEVALAGYVMTTGSRGLHVVVPLRPEEDIDAVRDLARGIADTAARRHPDRLTTEVRKNRRGGRLFLDTMRNSYAQHSVAPYAVRALPGAPVATPLSWSELERAGSAQVWAVRSLPRRLAELADRGDPWHALGRHARSPRRAGERLARLAGAGGAGRG